MALLTNATVKSDLFDPQVIGNLIDKKLFDYARFSPLAFIDTTLVGQPGSTVTLPYWNAIATASTVNEGADIPISTLKMNTVPAVIAKVGIGVQLTDEAVLSGFGDPIGQATTQIAMSIADKVDNDILTALSGASLTHTYTTFDDDAVVDGLVKFGEDMTDDLKTIVMGVNEYATLRKAGWLPDSDVKADTLINGTVGMIQGMPVVVTNKITNGDVYIVKAGAVGLYLKRDTLVEVDRDIVNKSTIITADKHYVAYLTDATKVVKLSV